MTDQTFKKTPSTFVVFGATGDLNQRKLIPAFFDLFVRGYLPENFVMAGFARKDLTHESYRNFVEENILARGHDHSSELMGDFLKHSYYVQGDFSNPNSYRDLSKFLVEHDKAVNACSNKMIYLAVPPNHYDGIFQNLADSGLSIGCPDKSGWTRILVEKPFGSDLKSAQALERKLSLLFKEEQTFRIDHYLVKETLENILAFRFSNNILEPAWNKEHIDKVHIRLFEDIGVEKRGAFYDSVGALRDVGQNHVLQMLALIAMEDPGSLNAEKIRAAREDVFKALRSFSPTECAEYTAKGQYASFRSTKGVRSTSNTETYFKIKAFIDNERWRGVPFVLEGGKKMSEKKTEITIYFKKDIACVCDTSEGHESHQNILTFAIQPEEAVHLTFWAKRPGFKMIVEPQQLLFTYQKTTELPPDAYEKLLLNTFEGDQTLFASSVEVECTWQFITPILEYWKHKEPEIYEDNSIHNI